MSSLVKKQKNTNKIAAVELLALQPSITSEQIAAKLGVSKHTVIGWRQDPNFIDACYDRYMLEFGSQLPSVLNAMIREAQAGNVQAGRLVLEHSGKLVKNINITVDSPFEKFLKVVPDAETVDDDEILDVMATVETEAEDLPPRNTENQGKRAKDEKILCHKAIKAEKKRLTYNEQQKEWYRWRKRAEKVGVKPLEGKRPTPAQRKDWEEEIIRTENAMKEDGTWKEKPKPYYSDDNNDWETPQELFDKLNEEFNFTLDPCASDRNHKCKKYYTIEDDGLSKDWSNEIVFMNPPYGKKVLNKWIKKAHEESLKGAVIVCLIPSYTSTKYWHDYIEGREVRFLKGRLKFNNRKAAPFSSCLVIFN